MRKEASIQEWKDLYQAATKIKELKPWEHFWDMDLIGIHVHGGGPEISDMLKRVGKQSRFVDGLRYTCLLYTSRCV